VKELSVETAAGDWNCLFRRFRSFFVVMSIIIAVTVGVCFVPKGQLTSPPTVIV
jgi:hypothetical protein